MLSSDGIGSLDYAYVCSGHASFNAQGLRVSGLENETEYQFLLVAYDRAGNPNPIPNPNSPDGVFRATPRATTDLWEACEMAGGVCGKGGFCRIGTPGSEGPASGGLLLLGGLLVRRRRRAAA